MTGIFAFDFFFILGIGVLQGETCFYVLKGGSAYKPEDFSYPRYISINVDCISSSKAQLGSLGVNVQRCGILP
jgi:hypothetical protein